MNDSQTALGQQSKVFLYLSVSTSDQNIEGQKFTLLDYCARQGATELRDVRRSRDFGSEGKPSGLK